MNITRKLTTPLTILLMVLTSAGCGGGAEDECQLHEPNTSSREDHASRLVCPVADEGQK